MTTTMLPGLAYRSVKRGASLSLSCKHLFSSSITRRKITVGDSVSEHRIITPEDVKLFSELTGDFNPIHRGKNPIVHGALLNGFVSGLIGMKLPGPGTILVKEHLRFPNPCYAEDSVTVTVKIAEVRKLIICSFSVISHKCNNIVLEGEAKVLFSELEECNECDISSVN